MIVIAAETKAGKTALALTILDHMAGILHRNEEIAPGVYHTTLEIQYHRAGRTAEMNLAFVSEFTRFEDVLQTARLDQDGKNPSQIERRRRK